MTEEDKNNLVKAAQAGGEILKKYFGQTLNPTEKTTPGDLQTEADLGSEKAILEILQKEFPSYNINSEEVGEIKNNSEYTFYIDPLDGTSNFVMGIPNFTVSIGLMQGKEIIAGVIYQPILDQTYFAVKGQEAYLNNKKISVSDIIDPKRILIGFCASYKSTTDYKASVVSALIKAHPRRLVWHWSIANDLCLLASGKIDSIISNTLDIYDYGAGKLIALEAGAEIIGFDGKSETDVRNNKFIISNNQKTNNYVYQIVQPFLE